MFTIGQFSWITQLPRKTLRYYDEIGLLKASKADTATGYRYYNTDLVFQAEKIKLLRKCNFTLAETEQYLLWESSGQTAKLKTLLDAKKKELQDLAADIQRTLLDINGIKTRLKEGTMIDCQIVNVPEQRVVSIRGKGTYQKTIPVMLGQLFQEIGKKGLKCVGAPVFVCHDEEYKEVDADIEMAVPVEGKASLDAPVKFTTLPGGRMAKVMHKGPYHEVSRAYELLFSWVEKNGYAPAGPTREVYLNDPHEVAQSELLTELFIPIK